MNQFKFFSGVIYKPTLDPFQTVPENHRIESVSTILYDPYTFIASRMVYCRHIVNTEQTFSFLISDTHWLWDHHE